MKRRTFLVAAIAAALPAAPAVPLAAPIPFAASGWRIEPSDDGFFSSIIVVNPNVWEELRRTVPGAEPKYHGELHQFGVRIVRSGS